MRSVPLLLLFASALLPLAGCRYHRRHEVEVGRIYVAAPPPRHPPAGVVVVTRPARPGPDHVWIEGHYTWGGGRWVWERGRWMSPPRHGAVWVPGHWSRATEGGYWIPGHWR